MLACLAYSASVQCQYSHDRSEKVMFKAPKAFAMLLLFQLGTAFNPYASENLVPLHQRWKSRFGSRILAVERDVPKYFQLYRANLDADPDLWNALNWDERENQQKRFEVFAAAIDFNGRSVLDVGCGQGDFAKHLVRLNVTPALLRGIDGMPEFVAEAKRKALPWEEYEVGDVFEPGTLGSACDWIVMSGVLCNLDPSQTQQLLTNCWRITRYGVAFNFPTTRGLSKTPVPIAPFEREGLMWERKDVGDCLWRYPPEYLWEWCYNQLEDCKVDYREKYIANNCATIILSRKTKDRSKLADYTRWVAEQD
mmetsp:Transcript_166767/g.320230  ORF Transcript_166767/g.320230 Transcript_166767/m.320230 type:complete len:309 (-) Transcript_166767:150-1076(-)